MSGGMDSRQWESVEDKYLRKLREENAHLRQILEDLKKKNKKLEGEIATELQKKKTEFGIK